MSIVFDSLYNLGPTMNMISFLMLNHGFTFMLVIFAISGIGSAIALSKPLAYISKSSSAAHGVFDYELFFGLGFIYGSLGGGLLFQYFGFLAAIIIFVPSMVCGIVFPEYPDEVRPHRFDGSIPIDFFATHFKQII